MMSPASPPPDAGASGGGLSLIIASNLAQPAYPPLSTLWTGLTCKCPRCGKGDLLQGFLTIRAACPACVTGSQIRPTGRRSSG